VTDLCPPTGLVVPIITPVDDQDQVDEPAYRAQISYLIEAGVDALFIGGTAGEGPLLEINQWQRMVEIARDQGGDQIPLLGGVTGTSTANVIDKIQRLEQLDYHFFVVTPTYYVPSSSYDEQLRLFAACREATDRMEMIAYNIPSTTGVMLSVDLLVDLANRKWIRAAKESSGDQQYLWNLIEAGREVGLSILVGDERLIAFGLVSGGSGIVPVCANFEPETYVGAVRACREGQFEKLHKYQHRAMQLRRDIIGAEGKWLAGVKYAVRQLGVGNGRAVAPRAGLTEKEQHLIDAVLNAAK